MQDARRGSSAIFLAILAGRLRPFLFTFTEGECDLATVRRLGEVSKTALGEIRQWPGFATVGIDEVDLGNVLVSGGAERDSRSIGGPSSASITRSMCEWPGGATPGRDSPQAGLVRVLVANGLASEEYA